MCVWELEGVWSDVWDHCTQGGETEGAQRRTEGAHSLKTESGGDGRQETKADTHSKPHKKNAQF